MKIGQVPGVSGVYNNQGVRKVESSKEVQAKKDVVSISGSGQDFNTIMKALREVPDIREDKVAQLTDEIKTGNYDVSTSDIVEKMLNKANARRI